MQQLAMDFWNGRGSHRLFGVVEIGTQISLVRRPDGRFLLLDSYDCDDATRDRLMTLTDGGAKVDAILNLHPFHTLHCGAMHAMFPAARLVGCRRHVEQWPDLPWSERLLDDPATHADYADTLDLSLPDGVLLVAPDEKVHAGSVLARHRASGIVHVDDTLMVLGGGGLLGRLLPGPRLGFHPTLGRALAPGAGAADAFAAWARRLADEWAGAPYVCAAHFAVRRLAPDGWRAEMLEALRRVQPTLDRHRQADR